MAVASVDKASGFYLVALQNQPVAGESAVMYLSRRFKPGVKPGIIYFAGKSAGSHNIVGAGWVQELARRGYPAICGDLGDVCTQWGNVSGPGVWGCDAALAKAETLRVWMETNGYTPAGSKVHVAGGSHGCAGAYAYARNYTDKVSSISCAIGTIDVDDIYVNNRGSGGGFAASIRGAAAYGSDAGWQAAKATHNPVACIPHLVANNIPMLDYYAPDDPWCVLATHQAAKTAAGSLMTQVSMGNVGHSFIGVGPIGNGGDAFVGAMADWVENNI